MRTKMKWRNASNPANLRERSMHRLDSTRYYTDNGRVVYGGGGISPDVFVPIDTIILNDEYLHQRQHAPQFVFRYMSETGKGMRRIYPNPPSPEFEVSDDLFGLKFVYGQSYHGVDNLTTEVTDNKMEDQKRFIKARIAKQPLRRRRVLYGLEQRR